ncbi:MAG: DnaD domain protein [Clostridia bacterium]|nr:DnaD domain protein [Clostridia bacterium]
MKFEQNFSMLFEDLNLPELFITEYFCNANGDYVKIYLYCLFLCKYGGEISALDLSKKLSIPIKSVEAGLKYWEEQKVLIKKNKTYELADLKMIAVNKLYTPKLTSSPEDAIENNERNVLRTQAINEINTSFFQGVMSPTWYTLIDNFFQKYSFDEDVMVALFRYCFDKQALHAKYIQAVAEGWANQKITHMSDLEKYSAEREQTDKIKKSISKKLGYTRNLTQFEEAYIEKWTKDFNYPMDVIEIALKKTTSTPNFNFKYLDSIITDWHEKNLNTSIDITNYIKEQKQKAKELKSLKKSIEQGQTTLPKYFSESGQYTNLDQYYSDL